MRSLVPANGDSLGEARLGDHCRFSVIETPVTSMPCGRIATDCRLPCVVNYRLAAKLLPLAAATMWSPLACPEMVPAALCATSRHEPERAPPR